MKKNINMPTISVVMSIYKEPIEWKHLSIDSILNQTFTDFEFIIINDYPDMVENKVLLDEYQKKDSRIVVISNERNIGLIKSLNRGLDKAQGKYIARMDADDIAMPQRLQKQVEYMDSHDDTIVCGSNVTYIGQRAWIYNILNFHNSGFENLKARLLLSSCFFHPTVIIRKSIIDEYHIRYEEDYKGCEDYRMWEVLMSYGEFARIPESLLKYRLSPCQVTHSKPIEQQKIGDSLRNRIQKNWLDSNNIIYRKEDLEQHPSNILNVLRNNESVKKQPEYNLFLRYVYDESWQSLEFKTLIMTDDKYYLPLTNIIYFVIRKLINS